MKNHLHARSVFVSAVFGLFGGVLSKAFAIDELPSLGYVGFASIFSLITSYLVSQAYWRAIPKSSSVFVWSVIFFVVSIGGFLFYDSQYTNYTFTYSAPKPDSLTGVGDQTQARYLRSDSYDTAARDYIQQHALTDTKTRDSILVEAIAGGIDTRHLLWTPGAIERTRYRLVVEYLLYVILLTIAICLPLEDLAKKSARRPRDEKLKIACLGWGSLIWNPKDLQVKGTWQNDGPRIPVEFSRQSADGRLTLVIDPLAEPVPVLWSYMKTSDLKSAKDSLKARESTSPRYIHSVTLKEETTLSLHLTIQQWCQSKGLDAAIWTGLPPKFNNRLQRSSEQQVIAYLRNLPPPVRTVAEEYVRKTPLQIKTRYRARIESELGWTPLPAAGAE